MTRSRAYGFLQFDQESYLARRLHEHGLTPLYGTSDTAVRRERFRNSILLNNLANEIVGSIGKKPETYAELFKRIYGEPLLQQRGLHDVYS